MVEALPNKELPPDVPGVAVVFPNKPPAGLLNSPLDCPGADVSFGLFGVCDPLPNKDGDPALFCAFAPPNNEDVPDWF